MRIALIITPLLFKRCPLIGMAYLASYLKKRGFDVDILDLNIEMGIPMEEDEKLWADKSYVENFVYENHLLLNYFVDRILETEAEIIGFSIWTITKYASLALADTIKQKNKGKLIVFGGPECSFSGKELIAEDSVDIVVYGEGEETLTEIAEIYQRDKKVDFCAGTLLKKGSTVIDCGYRNEIKDLDILPFPDFSNFTLERYYLPNSLSIMFNRGCWRKCVFCNASISWRKFRSRTAESIYKEMVSQVKKYPKLKKFEVDDTALNLNLKELSKLCDLIITNGLKIDWGGSAIIHPEMDFNFLKKMSKAGCKFLAYGLESGSQNVLDSMKKGFNIEDSERVIRDTHNAGIKVLLNIIIGFSNETEYDFQQTMDFIKNNKEYIFSVAYPSECWIGNTSYLYIHPEEFNINVGVSGDTWESKDGINTHNERQRRINIFNDFICSVGLSSCKHNFIKKD